MALALILVIGAGLFLRTLVTLETLDPGFRTDHLLLFLISPSAAKMPEEKVAALRSGALDDCDCAGGGRVCGRRWNSADPTAAMVGIARIVAERCREAVSPEGFCRPR